MTSKFGLFLAAAVVLSAAACSGSGSMSPTGPSGASGAQISGQVNGVSVSSTADVNGLSAGSLTQATSTSGSLKVSVNGTNIETTVDGTGHFELSGVPSGTIVLSFTGRGVNASVTIREVTTGDRIEIAVRIEGGGARVESENRRREDDNGDDDRDRNGNNRDDGSEKRSSDGAMSIEGSVSTLSGSCPALRFRLASWTVVTNRATLFEHITCAAIKSGSRLEVQGRSQADGSLLATAVDGRVNSD